MSEPAFRPNPDLPESTQRALGGYMANGSVVDREGAGQTGTSIFDPVLCELMYRWFCPPEGTILDPFAGGSVRGIVASKMGRRYVGVDLRAEQVEANREQAERICGNDSGDDETPVITDPEALTPVQRVGDYWVKRDDAFMIAGARGGKARACWQLAQGAVGVVTAGARQSPQVHIVARIANALGIPCRAHVPSGQLTPELTGSQAVGAEIVQHTPGYNTVIIKRARDDADDLGWLHIPFGMEFEAAVETNQHQVQNIPDDALRLVVPVGSGMSLAGILRGLAKYEKQIPVIGVCVGADPEKRLDRYAPKGWRSSVTLIESGIKYEQHAPVTTLGGVKLDPIYEAKCIPFLEPGDLLWVVGIRGDSSPSPLVVPEWRVGDSQNLAELCGDVEADFVFSCPPYGNLEVYSDDPADLSNMNYPEFVEGYRKIIAAAVDRLKPDRFAVFVVGNFRGKDGSYHDLMGDTVRAFQDAGCLYYNEAVLVTAIGSLPIRVGRQFAAGRKLGKTHQNILGFVKGSGKAATAGLDDGVAVDIEQITDVNEVPASVQSSETIPTEPE